MCRNKGTVHKELGHAVWHLKPREKAGAFSTICRNRETVHKELGHMVYRSNRFVPTSEGCIKSIWPLR